MCFEIREEMHIQQYIFHSVGCIFYVISPSLFFHSSTCLISFLSSCFVFCDFLHSYHLWLCMHLGASLFHVYVIDPVDL